MLVVPRCLWVLPESLRHLELGGLASQATHSAAEARRGPGFDLAGLLSPSARELIITFITQQNIMDYHDHLLGRGRHLCGPPQSRRPALIAPVTGWDNERY